MMSCLFLASEIKDMTVFISITSVHANGQTEPQNHQWLPTAWQIKGYFCIPAPSHQAINSSFLPLVLPTFLRNTQACSKMPTAAPILLSDGLTTGHIGASLAPISNAAHYDGCGTGFL
ncbi:Glutamine Amidotransferase-Like Class 1 Domain-Containing Protein 1 [Manis pentadactyla]|nr:Glutamine Amidotransferase-Like Class 1 Domain-Containing Protein 1 [Manis pentadactyla]